MSSCARPRKEIQDDTISVTIEDELGPPGKNILVFRVVEYTGTYEASETLSSGRSDLCKDRFSYLGIKFVKKGLAAWNLLFINPELYEVSLNLFFQALFRETPACARCCDRSLRYRMKNLKPWSTTSGPP